MITINDYPNAKPILFNTDMTKAILAGRKTVTRRVIKPQYAQHSDGTTTSLEEFAKGVDLSIFAPYQIGDILYVRETWQYIEGASGHGYAYKAGGGVYNDTSKWRPSIHMPKSAARIFLLVTDVRAERLQEISADDCHKEGVMNVICRECLQMGDCRPQRDVDVFCGGEDFIVDMFSELWNSTIKPADLPLYGWEANPWVWVYEFERVTENA